MHQTSTYYESGVFLSSKNVTSGEINWDDVKYIDEIQPNEMHKRVAPQINDILLAKNETTGVVAIVDFLETMFGELPKFFNSEVDKLPTLLQMKYGTAGYAVKVFGNPAMIQQTFTSFQKGLYK